MKEEIKSAIKSTEMLLQMPRAYDLSIIVKKKKRKEKKKEKQQFKKSPDWIIDHLLLNFFLARRSDQGQFMA